MYLDSTVGAQSFRKYFYNTVQYKCSQVYYEAFVNNALNDLNIVMNIDLTMLVNKCNMSRIHAKQLLKSIKILKESNEILQEWLVSIEMKKYYKQMIGAGIATLAMLERFDDHRELAALLFSENGNIDECTKDSAVILFRLLRDHSHVRLAENNMFQVNIKMNLVCIYICMCFVFISENEI